jgi:integrase/recombinase XerD
MKGRPAKVLGGEELRLALSAGRQRRYPNRSTVIILLSFKAGLRACEIARLTWPMVLDARGRVGPVLELPARAAKRGSGRRIPIHPELHLALIKLRKEHLRQVGNALPSVIRSERGGSMTAKGVVDWFRDLYGGLGWIGCSSHSGRRTFVTNAARSIHRAGGSLRDVQELVGHRSLATTQRYIEGDGDAQRRLMQFI